MTTIEPERRTATPHQVLPAHPELGGARVRWQDAQDALREARVEHYLGSGGLIHVYLVLEGGDNGTPVARLWAVKYTPLPGVLDREWHALQAVPARWRSLVPTTFRGRMVSAELQSDVLVVEFLDPASRWLALRDGLRGDADDVLVGDDLIRFIGATARCTDLLSDLAGQGIVNRDIKAENFFYLDGTRPVWSDWNTYDERPPEDPGLLAFEAVALKALLEILYKTLTRRSLKFPVPEVTAEAPAEWRALPTLLRRLLVDVNADRLTTEPTTRWLDILAAALDPTYPLELAALDRARQVLPPALIPAYLQALRADLRRSEGRALHGDADWLQQFEHHVMTWTREAEAETQSKAGAIAEVLNQVPQWIRNQELRHAQRMAGDVLAGTTEIDGHLGWRLVQWYAFCTLAIERRSFGEDLSFDQLAGLQMITGEAIPDSLIRGDRQCFVDLRRALDEADDLVRSWQGFEAQMRLEGLTLDRIQARVRQIDALALPVQVRPLLHKRLPPGWNDFGVWQNRMAEWEASQVTLQRRQALRDALRGVVVDPSHETPAAWFDAIDTLLIQTEHQDLVAEQEFAAVREAIQRVRSGDYAGALDRLASKVGTQDLALQVSQRLEQLASTWLNLVAAAGAWLTPSDAEQVQKLLAGPLRERAPEYAALSQRVALLRRAQSQLVDIANRPAPDATALGLLEQLVAQRVELWPAGTGVVQRLELLSSERDLVRIHGQLAAVQANLTQAQAEAEQIHQTALQVTQERDQIEGRLQRAGGLASLSALRTTLGDLQAAQSQVAREVNRLRETIGIAPGAPTTLADMLTNLTATLRAQEQDIARLGQELGTLSLGANRLANQVRSADDQITHLSRISQQVDKTQEDLNRALEQAKTFHQQTAALQDTLDAAQVMQWIGQDAWPQIDRSNSPTARPLLRSAAQVLPDDRPSYTRWVQALHQQDARTADRMQQKIKNSGDLLHTYLKCLTRPAQTQSSWIVASVMGLTLVMAFGGLALGLWSFLTPRKAPALLSAAVPVVVEGLPRANSQIEITLQDGQGEPIGRAQVVVQLIQDDVVAELVSATTQTDAEGRAIVIFRPTAGGRFLLSATAHDADGLELATAQVPVVVLWPAPTVTPTLPPMPTLTLVPTEFPLVAPLMATPDATTAVSLSGMNDVTWVALRDTMFYLAASGLDDPTLVDGFMIQQGASLRIEWGGDWESRLDQVGNTRLVKPAWVSVPGVFPTVPDTGVPAHTILNQPGGTPLTSVETLTLLPPERLSLSTQGMIRVQGYLVPTDFQAPATSQPGGPRP